MHSSIQNLCEVTGGDLKLNICLCETMEQNYFLKLNYDLIEWVNINCMQLNS